jgi:malate synthase
MAKAPKGIEVTPKISREAARVLTPDALKFIAELHRASAPERARLSELREARQAFFDKGLLPDFRYETCAIRNGDWKAAALPRDLLDQRAGIVTAPSRKELLAALNSGAKLCLADFADFTSPTWDNLIDGQINLMDRWTSAMEHVDPDTKKRVSLSQRLATLMVRPRALLRDEPRVKVDGKPVSAALFDAGLYLFHNAKVSLAKASAPYLCLSGTASQGQARLWNDILLHAQSLLGLPTGAIRVHMMVDDISAVFEVDEISYELRDHIAGLSPGGMSYAFSLIRSFSSQKTRVVADAGPLDEALSGAVIRAAHKRGLAAIAALARGNAKGDAERAVRQGFDGLWTSHPDQVAGVARIFNDDMPTPNQIYVTRDDAALSQKALLATTDTVKAEALFKSNIHAALLGLEAWLSGRGTVVVDGSLEDTASIEFRRAQIWQWLRYGVKLDSGAKLNPAMFEMYLAETLKQVKSSDGRFKEASSLLKSLCLAKEFVPGITALAMRKLA